MHRQVQMTLRELGVGYLDLMLLHWPSPGGGVGGQAAGDEDAAARPKMAKIDPLRRAKRIAAWKVLEHYHSMGWLRAIGTSNFHEVHVSIFDYACLRALCIDTHNRNDSAAAPHGRRRKCTPARQPDRDERVYPVRRHREVLPGK